MTALSSVDVRVAVSQVMCVFHTLSVYRRYTAVCVLVSILLLKVITVRKKIQTTTLDHKHWLPHTFYKHRRELFSPLSSLVFWRFQTWQYFSTVRSGRRSLGVGTVRLKVWQDKEEQLWRRQTNRQKKKLGRNTKDRQGVRLYFSGFRISKVRRCWFGCYILGPIR